jgi:hypothetical protein
MCSIDEHGWPHPAMASRRELVAADARNIRFAMDRASRTSRNLRANGHLTLIVADEQGVFYLKGDVRQLAPTTSAAPARAKFNMRVDSVLEDSARADEQVRIVSGIRLQRTTGGDPHAEALLRELLD